MILYMTFLIIIQIKDKTKFFANLKDGTTFFQLILMDQDFICSFISILLASLKLEATMHKCISWVSLGDSLHPC